MPGWVIPLIIILAVVVAVFIILYFVGKKLQARQDSQQEAIESMSQTMTLYIIDKKKMKIKEAGLPKIVYEQTPKYLRWSKVPCLKVKVGPKVTTMLCDGEVFKTILPKQEVKATVSGLYVTAAKRIRGPVYEAPKKKRFKFF